MDVSLFRVSGSQVYAGPLEKYPQPFSIHTPSALTAQPFSPTAVSILSEATDQPPEPALLTLDEVAAALGMSKKSVQRRIKSGLIRKASIGGRLVRISSDELRRLTSGGLFLDPPKDADPD